MFITAHIEKIGLYENNIFNPNWKKNTKNKTDPKINQQKLATPTPNKIITKYQISK